MLVAVMGCGASVIDHHPGPNVLDADSATLEASTGKWRQWYSSSVSRSADGAKAGDAGMQIDVTARFGWGVQCDNWPGFAATPGPHRFTAWVRAEPRSTLAATFVLTWRNESGTELEVQRHETPTLSEAWLQQRFEVEGPAGATRVGIAVTGGEDGDVGERLFVDSISLTAPVTP